MEEQKDQLNNALEVMQDEIEYMKQQLTKEQKDYYELELKYKLSNDTITKLRSEFENIKQEKEHLKQEYEDLRQDNQNIAEEKELLIMESEMKKNKSILERLLINHQIR